jgi:hypothetical protein
MARAKASAAKPALARTDESVWSRTTTIFLVLLSIVSLTAIWSILSLISGGYGGYFALLVAVGIVSLLKIFGFDPGFKRAFIATLMMGLSVLYQSYLFAAGTIAGEMGFSLREAAQLIDADFAFALVRAHTTIAELGCYLLSLLLAGVLGLIWTHASAETTTRR